jgi:hypothetical protein
VSPKFTRGGERPKPQPGELLDVRGYELHGTPYFAILYRLDADPDRRREARVSFEMIYPEPRPGDRIEVQQVLGVVDRVMKAT